MVIASTLATIETVIPYVILAGVVVFISFRFVVIPLVDFLRHTRKRKSEHAE